jgi:hypothetical protein
VVAEVLSASAQEHLVENQPGKALTLIESGMQPAGLEAVQRAKKDGCWRNAYDSPSRARVPSICRQHGVQIRVRRPSLRDSTGRTGMRLFSES